MPGAFVSQAQAPTVHKELFLDSHAAGNSTAPLGRTWLLSVFQLENSTKQEADDALKPYLHALLLNKNIPRQKQLMPMFGHVVDAKRAGVQVGALEDRAIHCPSDLDAFDTQLRALSPQLNATGPPAHSLARLQVLRTQPIGGILCVVKPARDDDLAFITCLTAPVLAPAASSDAPGHVLEDIWDEELVQSFRQEPDAPLCPLLAAMAGKTRSLDATALGDPDAWLNAAHPWLVPNGQHLCDTVPVGTQHILRALFLPGVCDLPTGMFWPTSTSLATFLRSLDCLHKPLPHLMPALQGIEDQLSSWFDAVNADETPFRVLAVPLNPMRSQLFPFWQDGALPSSVTSSLDLNPMIEMLNGFLWRLQVDHQLAYTESAERRTTMQEFLRVGSLALQHKSYLGTGVHPSICPNFPNHFSVTGGWPIDDFDPLAMFSLPGLRSKNADSIAPIQFSLFEGAPSELGPLTTKDELSVRAHKSTSSQKGPPNRIHTQRTDNSVALHDPVVPHTNPAPPQRSELPAMAPPMNPPTKPPPQSVVDLISQGPGTAPPPAPTAPEHSLLPPPTIHPNLSHLPPPGHHAVPSTGPALAQAPPMQSGVAPPAPAAMPPPQPSVIWSPPAPPQQPSSFGPPSSFAGYNPRSLFSGQMHPGPAPTPFVELSSAEVKRLQDPRNMTLLTVPGRQHADSSFADWCRVLAHGPLDPNVALVPIREPTMLFRRDIAPTVLGLSKNTGEFAEFWNLFEGMLVRQGRDTTCFHRSWFTHAMSKAFYSFAKWNFEVPATQTFHDGDFSFHVYHLFSSLRGQSRTNSCLPDGGISPADAEHLGHLLFTLFSLMDAKDGLQNRKFPQSLLGTRLSMWRDLPAHSVIQAGWKKSPASFTCLWFRDLRLLLAKMVDWVKHQRLNKNHGCQDQLDPTTGHTHLTSRVDTQVSHLAQGQTFLRALAAWDEDFTKTWSQSNFDPEVAPWNATVPARHMLAAFLNKNPPAPPSRSAAAAPTPAPAPASNSRAPAPAPARPAKKPKKEWSFVSSVPMFIPTQAVEATPNAHTQIRARMTEPYPKYPTLDPIATGKPPACICFKSCFSPPHNVCRDTRCRGRLHHVDLSQSEWKNKPESFWKPVVEFLRNEKVSPLLQPSDAFKALTPSEQW